MKRLILLATAISWVVFALACTAPIAPYPNAGEIEAKTVGLDADHSRTVKVWLSEDAIDEVVTHYDNQLAQRKGWTRGTSDADGKVVWAGDDGSEVRVERTLLGTEPRVQITHSKVAQKK